MLLEGNTKPNTKKIIMDSKEMQGKMLRKCLGFSAKYKVKYKGNAKGFQDNAK